MAKFRIDKIAELSRQLSFTPQEARLAQLSAAEELLLEIDCNKAYPLDFVVYRITGYHPRNVDQTLLTGLALQHDIGLLIEQTSDTLNQLAQAAGQPVLTLDQASERFNVTGKTVQRWRRRGLASRRFIFPDGKHRIGFLVSTIEKFMAVHSDQAVDGGNFTEVTETEKSEILRRAQRLVRAGSCNAPGICRRIARRLNRSPLTIAHVLRPHDLLSRASAEIPAEERAELLRDYRKGESITLLARRFSRSRCDVHRVVVEDRLARLLRRKTRFIDDPLYHQTDAAAFIQQLGSQDLLAEPKKEETRIPADLPRYLQDLYRTPLLSAAHERALFIRLNFYKFQFVTARRRIEPQFVRCRELKLLESIRRRIIQTKDEIVRANLRLVVSVARKHFRPGLAFMDLISDGNLTLVRSVDSFNIHKGTRFSTYATLGLMKGYARSVPRMQCEDRRATQNPFALDGLADARDAKISDRVIQRDHVRQLLSKLEPRERDVIQAHFGLSDSIPATYEELGTRLGLSRQRVRQIEQSALEKLRRDMSV